jgi:hypothetical protein
MMDVSKKTLDIRNILSGLNISMERLLESKVLNNEAADHNTESPLPPSHSSFTSKLPHANHC